MIPPFHTAVDRAITYLDPVHGLLGVTDFFVPSRYDLPLRQMSLDPALLLAVRRWLLPTASLELVAALAAHNLYCLQGNVRH